MSGRTRVLEIIDQFDRSYAGLEDRPLFDEALALLRDLDDEELEYRLRMRHTVHANYIGDTDALLSSFAWCLARYDADPHRFPAEIDDMDLLWQYKWMATAVASSPLFPSEQIDAVLDDMEAHYRRAGLGLSGVIMSRFEAAWSQGKLEEAERIRHELLITPRDSHSHCEACGPSQDAAFLMVTGREAEALQVTDEMLESGATCGEEPEHAMARALLPMLRAGRAEEAKAAHMSAYRISRGNPEHLPMIADHLIFCVVSGNVARGLALLERHLGWLAHDGLDVESQVAAMRAVGVVLDAVVESGHPELPVRGADAQELVAFFGEHDGPWTASQLAPVAWAWVASTDQQFDTRNGNDYFARTTERIRASARERHEVAIETETFAPPAVQEPDPIDGPGWLQRAEERFWLAEDRASLDALGHVLHADDVDERQRAIALGLLPTLLLRLGEPAEAAAVMADRVEALQDDDRDDEADLEARLGLLVHREDLHANGGHDFRVLERELADAEASGVEPTALATLRTLVLSGLSRLAAADPDRDEDERIIALAEQVRADLAHDPDDGRWRAATAQLAQRVAGTDLERAGELVAQVLPHTRNRVERGRLLMLAARMAGSRSDHPAGAQQADAAMRVLSAAGGRALAGQAAALAGHLYEDADDPGEAVSRFRFAVGQAELSGGDVSGLRFSLGRAMVRAGQAAEAAEILQDVLAAEERAQESPGSLALTAFWLGHASQESGAYWAALNAWERSAELFAQDENPGGASRSHRLRAQLLWRFEELEDAQSAATAALEHARAADAAGDTSLLLDALHLLGNLEISVQGQPGLIRLREARDLAETRQEEWQVADITDSEARALATLERFEESVSHGLYAADLYAQVGDPDGAANAESAVAAVLASQGRHADAVPILHAAGEKAQHPMFKLRILLELGDVYEALGRHHEATQVRAQAQALQP